ncbi:MAG: hypothetical protein J5I81_13495 [Nitrococcus mobilis]|nr:hypothetical protein [Nitrococcus mobilis]
MNESMMNGMMVWMMGSMGVSVLLLLVIAITVIIQAVLQRKTLREIRRLKDNRGG